ncbi:hypothetical protein K438DRAFT_1979102 [Mycena galopus ATCC 62051]|nr:hypothetical protein K438DRAFT_1979102 [Mycena galopus ATCC 62051]
MAKTRSKPASDSHIPVPDKQTVAHYIDDQAVESGTGESSELSEAPDCSTDQSMRNFIVSDNTISSSQGDSASIQEDVITSPASTAQPGSATLPHPGDLTEDRPTSSTAPAASVNSGEGFMDEDLVDASADAASKVKKRHRAVYSSESEPEDLMAITKDDRGEIKLQPFTTGNNHQESVNNRCEVLWRPIILWLCPGCWIPGIKNVGVRILLVQAKTGSGTANDSDPLHQFQTQTGSCILQTRLLTLQIGNLKKSGYRPQKQSGAWGVSRSVGVYISSTINI